MLDSIPSSGTPKPPVATSTAPAGRHSSAVPKVPAATVSREAVVVSITTTLVNAAVAAPASAPSAPSAPSIESQPAFTQPGSDTSNPADQQAERGLQALSQMDGAKVKADGIMKDFFREKLDGLQKQLLVLRLIGTNPLDIAKGSVGIAREVAKTVRDYAADTIDQNNAGGGGTGGSGSTDSSGTSSAAATSAGTGTDTTTITAKQARQQAGKLQQEAASAPLGSDPGFGDPPGAPTDPDDRFFYDAYRLLGQVKKTLVDAQRVDIGLHGSSHAQAFKKLNQRETTLEQTVTDAYVAMKTGGDLKAVDAAISAGSPDSGASSDVNILA